MRPLLVLALLFVTAPCALAGAPAARPHSAGILLRLHPAAWQPPVQAVSAPAGMRLEPETGEIPPPPAITSPRARTAAAGVRTDADGSRHSLLGGAIRAYTVVHVDDKGDLVEDCVSSRAEAIRRVNATSVRAPGAAEKTGGH